MVKQEKQSNMKKNIQKELSLHIEKKKRWIKVSDSPKTYKQVPYDMTIEDEKSYIAKHYDENGRFICQPPYYEVYG